MVGQFKVKVVVGGTSVLVGLVVGLVAAAFSSGPTNSFYLPVVSYDFTALQWTEVGVSNAVESTFEIDPSDPETFYVGTIGQGGAWRSRDSGQSWEVMGNGLPLTVTVRQFASAPVSPTVIYAEAVGSYPYQIFHSLDGGDNWQGLTRVHAYRLMSLAVNPITPTTVYAGASVFDSTTYGGEVYRSIDGGNSWIQILPSFTLAADIAVDPQNPDVVYLGRIDRGLLKSSDGGDGWQPMNIGLPSNEVTVRNILIHPLTLKLFILRPTADSIGVQTAAITG